MILDHEIRFMQRALELAGQGTGIVEPNPMVGCVLVKENQIVGEGYHQRYGGPHAEIEAIRNAGERSVGATCYVTLEPCSHHGKTPPCAEAILQAGVKRVVLAMRDPNPVVNGLGVRFLQANKIEVEEHLLESEARSLNAPYITRFEKKRPWIVAKWAMTLDGKLASRTNSSHWISGEKSRVIVHQLRGRMDAIMVGSQTVLLDDSLLTVRLDESSSGKNSRQTIPENDPKQRRFMDQTYPKTPLRIILDSKGKISLDSRMVQTAKNIPALIVVDPDAPADKIDALQKAGCEILRLTQRIPDETTFSARNRERDQRDGTPQNGVPRSDQVAKQSFFHRTELGAASRAEAIWKDRMIVLFEHLLKRGVNQVLVEGGSRLFGTLFDMKAIDEVHAFIAPKLIGGDQAVPVVGGVGLPDMVFAYRLESPKLEIIDQDIYVHGRVRYPEH